MQFLTKVFQSVVKEKDFTSLSSLIRKAELENKLMVSRIDLFTDTAAILN